MPPFPRKKPNPDGRPSKYHIQANLISGVGLILLSFYATHLILGDMRREKLVHDTFVATLAQITDSRTDVDRNIPARPYYLMLNYNYSVGGKPYAGATSLKTGDGAKGQANAEHMAQKYRVGSYLRIYYDPANPVDNTPFNAPPDTTTAYLVPAGFWLFAIAMFIRGIAGLRYLGP